MIAKCEGYDKNGMKMSTCIDVFRRHIVYEGISEEEIADTPDIILYGSPRADDTLFNLIYFEDKDKNILSIVQTGGVSYLMDDSGRTFEVIRLRK